MTGYNSQWLQARFEIFGLYGNETRDPMEKHLLFFHNHLVKPLGVGTLPYYNQIYNQFAVLISR